jgi:hypothetical protein
MAPLDWHLLLWYRFPQFNQYHILTGSRYLLGALLHMHLHSITPTGQCGKHHIDNNRRHSLHPFYDGDHLQHHPRRGGR